MQRPRHCKHSIGSHSYYLSEQAVRIKVQLTSISLLYQSTMTKHWDAYQQRLKDLKDL